MKSRGLDPLRLVILVALTAFLAIRIGFWLKDDERGKSAPAGTGVISGVVLDTGGRPLETVNIRVSSPWRFTTTDARGRFSITRLPAGTYEISTEKDGYLSPDYGAGWLGPPSATIQLEDDQQIDSVTITMAQGGAITGVVYDEKGQPAGGRFVRALRPSPHGPDFSLGRRSIWSTDEQGRYRITGLAAGEYVVMAALDRAALQRVYYPNASRMADAKPTVVELGQERAGVDLHAQNVRTSRIEGAIARADGTPVSVPIDLIRSGEPEPDDRRFTATADANGRFKFDDVAADDYWIVAHTTMPGTVGGSRGSTQADAAPLWATADVSTDGRHPVKILLTLQPGQTISGKLAFQQIAGTAQPDFDKLNTYLFPADARTRAVFFASGRARLRFSASGEFTSVAPPGKYVVRDVYIGPWWLDSAVVEGERLDVPFDVQADRDISGAVLTLTDQLSEVNGTVQVQARPLPSQLVVAFSADDRFWGWMSPRARATHSDAHGRFVLAHLPAGEYFVAAPDAVGTGMWFDFTFLAKLHLQATRITLAPGERQTLTISLQTPPR